MRERPGRVVVVSNRVPPAPKEGQPMPAGGLVSAILPPLAAHGGVWFGWSGRTGNPHRPPQREVTPDIDYVHIDLSETEVADYYEGFCNRTLWPRLHGLAEHAASLPREYWTYRSTNRRFALALFPLLLPDDVVWVHDYHLMPLGRELRRIGWRGPLGYFHHVPIPEPIHWDAVSHADDLAASLGAYELIGLQTERDAERLRAILDPRYHGQIGVHPVGIDPERFRARSAEVPNPLAREGDNREILFGVDRLDYTKGIRARLEAFERLLVRLPHLHKRLRFVQWAAPSREAVPEYQAEREAVRTIAERINARFQDPYPVELSLESHPPEEVGSGLRAADICVVTSLADGMNLVAKEFCAVHSGDEPGTLVLSDTCGAAAQLTDALLVRATDPGSIEAALERAVRMSPGERARRSATLRRVVDESTAERWFHEFLSDLDARRGGGQIEPRESGRPSAEPPARRTAPRDDPAKRGLMPTGRRARAAYRRSRGLGRE